MTGAGVWSMNRWTSIQVKGVTKTLASPETKIVKTREMVSNSVNETVTIRDENQYQSQSSTTIGQDPVHRSKKLH